MGIFNQLLTRPTVRLFDVFAIVCVHSGTFCPIFFFFFFFFFFGSTSYFQSLFVQQSTVQPNIYISSTSLQPVIDHSTVNNLTKTAELDALRADLLHVRAALAAERRGHRALAAEFARFRDESEQLSIEWLAEADAAAVPRPGLLASSLLVRFYLHSSSRASFLSIFFKNRNCS